MELNKSIWTKSDGFEFQEYLKSFKRDEAKIEWTKKIINTKMPVLAITSANIKGITKAIKKGNYISFIELWLFEYYENAILLAKLIDEIENFDDMKSYLDKLAENTENWAVCDAIGFSKINSKNKEKYFGITEEYITSKLPFKRRIGVDILFKFVSDDNYIYKIFDILDRFYYETEYYVNMANAWLLCESFIKQRDKTYEYLKRNNLNHFTINKGISKCRDSFRVSKEDKEALLAFKK